MLYTQMCAHLNIWTFVYTYMIYQYPYLCDSIYPFDQLSIDYFIKFFCVSLSLTLFYFYPDTYVHYFYNLNHTLWLFNIAMV